MAIKKLLLIFLCTITFLQAISAANCTEDANCTTSEPYCSGGVCVECTENSHCSGTEICSNNICEEAPECANGETQPCDTGEQGICSQGTQTCNDEEWETCQRDNNPTTENCNNGFDDDCDGKTDLNDNDCLSPEIELHANPTTITENEEIEFTIIIVPNGDQIQSINIEFGDGNNQQVSASGSAYFVNHQYAQSGSYTAEVEVNFLNSGVKTTNIPITVEENSSSSQNNENQDPTLELEYPTNNQEIGTKTIKFRFTPNDDTGIEECVFKIFKAPDGENKLEYNETVSNPNLGEEIEISLYDFEETEYSWEVKCTDEDNEEIEVSRKFRVLIESKNYGGEISYVLDMADKFLDDYSSFTQEEKEALEELELMDNIKFYKKRLVQISQDLSTNTRMIADKDEREGREAELLAEMHDIRDNIPTKVETINTEEYIKNSKTDSLEEISQEYVDARNMDLNEHRVKLLAKKNKEIQTLISTSTKVSQIKIEYNDSEEIITLIKKEIKISGSKYTKILESLPTEMAEPFFLTNAEKLTPTLYEIDSEELESNTITYYLKEQISESKVKETQTMLFEKFPTDGFILTGYSIFNIDIGENFAYFFIVFCIFVGGIFLYVTKFNPKFIRDENVKRIKSHIKKGLTATKQEDIERAKRNYNKIREHYLELSKDNKKRIYSKLQQLKDEINKKEMAELIREYKRTKRRGMENESQELFDKIKSKYTHLPDKYQKQVREKIIMQY